MATAGADAPVSRRVAGVAWLAASLALLAATTCNAASMNVHALVGLRALRWAHVCFAVPLYAHAHVPQTTHAHTVRRAGMPFSCDAAGEMGIVFRCARRPCRASSDLPREPY